MLYSEMRERSRRFRLALRMGIPILLLIGIVLFYIIRQVHLEIDTIDVSIFLVILFVSIYFLFFLINLGQSETCIDRMTGAFVRTYLMRELKKAMKKSPAYSIVLLRIDNLPFINDHYGIDRGDRLLRTLVHLLDDFFKLNGIKEPIIGRYHGGDFIVGLPLDAEQSLKLLDEFASTYKEVNNIALELNYADAQKDEASDLNALVNYLYDTIFQQKMERVKKPQRDKRVNIDRLESEIVEAVEEGALQLHYLPSLNLKADKVDLFEVAVRLKTATSGVLPPKKFIPIVNRLGMEKRFDTALFEAVCKDAVQVAPGLRFSFNISPFSLRDDTFVEAIAAIAAKTGVDYRRLVIELFENRPFKDTKRYRVVLDELRELGMRFALDNFGAPNASFEYVKQLPVDMVQFDREFTISYNNPKIAALFGGYVQAFRNMGVKTLVKWVDSEEAFARFRQLGVDYAQGFIVSNRPYCSETLIKKYGANA
ncbi:EAL domain-containing protein [Hydrogenimonas sp.]